MKPFSKNFTRSEWALILRRSVVGLFVVVILGYALYETRGLMGGPIVRVSEPSDGFITASSTIALKGTAKRVTNITVNGRAILIDQNGNFNEELLLRPGHTILELTAVDTFSRKTVQQIRIIRTDGRKTKLLSEPAS